MARDWTELLPVIEGHYPTSVGAGGQDNVLHLSLTMFANSLFKEIERQRRWSLAYARTTFVTAAGTQYYVFPTALLVISRMYYILPSGQIVPLENFDGQELRRIFGEGSNSQRGSPRYFTIAGAQIELFPSPDDNAGANYTLQVEGYQALTPIIETSGTTTAGNATLTVPSTAYLTARALPTLGTNLSVRGAGNLGPGSVAGTHLTGWLALPTPTTVTMATNAVTAVSALAAQVYFNSTNWLIQDFDKVVLFGVMREAAAYLKENYDVWERRYQQELALMADFDFDRKRTLEQMATAVTGQRQAQLRTLDYPAGYEVRGGIVG